MAAALLERHAAVTGARLEVSSAGFAPPGHPAEPETVAAMAEIGVDLSAHRSRQLDQTLLEGTDLALTMTRQHLVDALLLAPAAWERLFTLVDLVNRATSIGPRKPREDPGQWVARAQAGRTRRDVIALPLTDDIADPVGRPVAEHARIRDRLDALTLDVARALR